MATKYILKNQRKAKFLEYENGFPDSPCNSATKTITANKPITTTTLPFQERKKEEFPGPSDLPVKFGNLEVQL